MAITNVTISQDNKVGDSNLIPIHSPVIFIADVTYTGLVPTVLLVEIYDTTGLLDTYRAIPYRDPLATVRQFVFTANTAIKGLMKNFDDFNQLNETLLPVPNITKEFTLKFVDPDNDLTFDEVLIDFLHGYNQFGENPNKDAQFNNDSDDYFAGLGQFVYVYFYNDDANNDVAIDGPILTEDDAADFDDTIFTDFDDEIFTIKTLI